MRFTAPGIHCRCATQESTGSTACCAWQPVRQVARMHAEEEGHHHVAELMQKSPAQLVPAVQHLGCQLHLGRVPAGPRSPRMCYREGMKRDSSFASSRACGHIVLCMQAVKRAAHHDLAAVTRSHSMTEMLCLQEFQQAVSSLVTMAAGHVEVKAGHSRHT